MKRNTIFYYLITMMLFSFVSLSAVGYGRIDAGPLWMKIKFQNDGRTYHEVDMWGARSDAILLPLQAFGYGVCIKPFVFGGKGKNSDLLSYGGSIGHYTPITEKLTIVPLVGVSHTNIHLFFDNIPIGNNAFEPNRQKTESNTFFIGGELILKLNPNWYLTGIYQYGWSRMHTRVGDNPIKKRSSGGSAGSNVGFLLDYYFNDRMSVNLGFAYNTSLDENKFGIVGYGFKTGLTYLF